MLKEIVDFCEHEGLNIIQMPCPETLHSGLPRDPNGKKWYEAHGFRPFCGTLAEQQAGYAKLLTNAGKRIVGVIGMEFSPACSTIENSTSPYRQYGIFMEELKKALAVVGLTPVFISINPDWHKKMREVLRELQSPIRLGDF